MDTNTFFRLMLEGMTQELPTKLDDRPSQLLVESWLLAGSVAAEMSLRNVDQLAPFLTNWDKMELEDRGHRLNLVWELFTFVLLFRWAQAQQKPDDLSLAWAQFVFGLFNSPEEMKDERIRTRFWFYHKLRQQMNASQMSANDLMVLWVRAIPGGDKPAQEAFQAVFSHMKDDDHFPVSDAVDALAIGIPSLNPLESAGLGMVLSQADKVMYQYISDEPSA